MRTILTAAATLLTLSVSNAAASTTNLLAFGDSLLDSGNVALALGDGFASGVYPNGQFTNGDAWTTQLGLTPSLAGGTNFGWGGARAVDNGDFIPDLISQIKTFRASGIEVDQNTAATVWVGGNDFLNLDDNPSFEEISATVAAVVENIEAGVRKLGHSGVGKVLVLGLPDFGFLPENAGDVAATLQASALSAFYNSTLSAMLSELNPKFRYTDIGYFDVTGIFDELVAQVPAELLAVPCLADPAGCAANPGDYLFYDDIHPSEWVHSVLAEAVAKELELGVSEVPLPASGLLLVAGLGGLGVWSRRRKSHA